MEKANADPIKAQVCEVIFERTRDGRRHDVHQAACDSLSDKARKQAAFESGVGGRLRSSRPV
ncbi:MAG: hypothetical protein ABR878_08095 [Roseiarcus sp.]|jgi:hypothetical protein